MFERSFGVVGCAAGKQSRPICRDCAETPRPVRDLADVKHAAESLVGIQDFNATMAYALGLPLEYEVYSPSGRPFKVAHDGTPLKALF